MDAGRFKAYNLSIAQLINISLVYKCNRGGEIQGLFFIHLIAVAIDFSQ